MPKTNLTDVTLKNLKPPQKGQTTYWDASLTGFGVRISQGGAKSFVVMHGRNRERTTIGRYPTVTLADARTAAKRILAERTLNRHRPVSISFEDALQAFLKAVKGDVRPGTYNEYKRLLERHWQPSLRHTKLEDISPYDIHKKLDRMANKPQEQAHALTALKRFLNWAMSRHYLDRSPATAITAGTFTPRDRVLDEDEIAAVWRAATSYPFGQIVRLCLLTGMRRGEAATLHWRDLTEDAITVPQERSKNRTAHTVPRTALIDTTLEDVKNIHDTLLFPARGKDTPFSGWSKCKAALDREAKVTGYTLHDLRRTFSTQLASLGVAPHIVEALLNHKSGTISGVAAIYNRFDYFDEKKAALEQWHEKLQRLAAG